MNWKIMKASNMEAYGILNNIRKMVDSNLGKDVGRSG
jgi:hypothetical protein